MIAITSLTHLFFLCFHGEASTLSSSPRSEMGVNPIEHLPANLFQGLDVLYNISAWQMKLLDLPPTLLRNLPSLLEMLVHTYLTVMFPIIHVTAFQRRQLELHRRAASRLLPGLRQAHQLVCFLCHSHDASHVLR